MEQKKPMNGASKGAIGGAIGGFIGYFVIAQLFPGQSKLFIFIGALAILFIIVIWNQVFYGRLNKDLTDILTPLHDKRTKTGNRFQYKIRDIENIGGHRVPLKLTVFITNKSFSPALQKEIEADWARVFPEKTYHWDWHITEKYVLIFN
jgi:hypothetical protein